MKGWASLPLLKGPVSLKFGLVAAFVILVAFPGAVIAQASLSLTNTETN